MSTVLVESTNSVIVSETNTQFITAETTSTYIVAGSIGPRGEKGDTGEAGGSSISETAPSNIGGHRVLAYISGILSYADCQDITSVNSILGISTNAASTGQPIDVLRAGKLQDLSWTWNTTLPIYLGTNGVLVQTLPPTALYSVVVAIPVSATEIFVTIREPIVLSQE